MTMAGPQDWEERVSRTTGRKYWYNRRLGTSSWTRPKDTQPTAEDVASNVSTLEINEGAQQRTSPNNFSRVRSSRTSSEVEQARGRMAVGARGGEGRPTSRSFLEQGLGRTSSEQQGQSNPDSAGDYTPLGTPLGTPMEMARAGSSRGVSRMVRAASEMDVRRMSTLEENQDGARKQDGASNGSFHSKEPAASQRGLKRTNTFPDDPPSPSKAGHDSDMALAQGLDKPSLQAYTALYGDQTGGGGSFGRQWARGGSMTSVKSLPASSKRPGMLAGLDAGAEMDADAYSNSRGALTPRGNGARVSLEQEEKARRTDRPLQRAGSEAPDGDRHARRSTREGSVPLTVREGQLQRSNSEMSMMDREKEHKQRDRRLHHYRDHRDLSPDRRPSTSIYVVKEDSQDKRGATEKERSPKEEERAGEASARRGGASSNDRRPGLSRSNSSENLLRLTSDGTEDNLGQGDDCCYIDRDQKLIPAKVARIDRSIRPWGYEIYMISQDRFVTTERHRLLHVNEASAHMERLQGQRSADQRSPRARPTSPLRVREGRSEHDRPRTERRQKSPTPREVARGGNEPAPARFPGEDDRQSKSLGMPRVSRTKSPARERAETTRSRAERPGAADLSSPRSPQLRPRHQAADIGDAGRGMGTRSDRPRTERSIRPYAAPQDQGLQGPSRQKQTIEALSQSQVQSNAGQYVSARPRN